MRGARSSSEQSSDSIQVIEDEDLEMARAVEKQREAKRKATLEANRKKAGKPAKAEKSTRKRKTDEKPSSSKNNKKSKKRKKNSSSEDEKSDESEDEEEESDDDVQVKKTRKKDKKSRRRSSESDASDSNDAVNDEDVKMAKAVEKQREAKRKATLEANRKKDGKDKKSQKPSSSSKKSKKDFRKTRRSRSSSNDDDEESKKESDEDEEVSSKSRKKSDKSSKKDSRKKRRSRSSSEDEKSESEEEEDDDEEEEKSSEDEKSSSDEELMTKKNKKNIKVASISSDSEEEVMPQPRRRGPVARNEPPIIGLSSDEEEREKERKRKKKRKEQEDSDDELVLPTRGRPKKEKNNEEEKKKKRGVIMDQDSLAQETIDAEKAEKERRKRLEARQKEFNGIELEETEDLTEALIGKSSQRKVKTVILDQDPTGDPPSPVSVHPSLVKVLKPHQAHGIQFMFNCAFESVALREKDGSGAILAHCMGLGKTLQVISFLHTVMMHQKIGEQCRRVLVVVPKNVIINWFKEFQKWLTDNDEELDTIRITELDSAKTVEERSEQLRKWHNSKKPAVMIIGYDLFRILTAEPDPKKKKPKTSKLKKFLKAQEDFRTYLQNPGPDLVVCDEAHKLKNDESALSKTMTKIRTKRRVCLTGTPLQNHLMEYHCMVSFVKPGLLGTKAEFANRFANIINRGRTKDASELDVKFMRRRCHVLFKQLNGCVDRKDYSVLAEAIPPKQEYVVKVNLTDRQCKLYRAFLDNVVGHEGGLSKRLLPDYHILARIWTHPYQLVLHEQKLERERVMREEEEEEADFIDDGDGSGEESEGSYSSQSEESEGSFRNSDSDEDNGKKKNKKSNKKPAKKVEKPSTSRRRIAISDEDSDEKNDDDEADTAMDILRDNIRQSKRLAGDAPDMSDDDTPPEYTGWFSKLGLVEEADMVDFSLSNKLVLLISIIKQCEVIGDKLLVFSQSLESLKLIKRMLEYLAGHGLWFTEEHEALVPKNETWSWIEGDDYMVIDGSVQSVKRDSVQAQFNDPNDPRARLMLISTRAGSLGTNMVAANRVVIFDACWNPSHDTQSLFRVYRFGQTKPVYIYRFIAHGTMEDSIYKRQVTKESVSMRVVDEAQIQRHYDNNDLEALYQFTPYEKDSDVEHKFTPPNDRLLALVLLENPDAAYDCKEHDTLFVNQEEEKLTEDERKEADNEYENDKNPPPMPAQRIFGGVGIGNGSIQARDIAARQHQLRVLQNDQVFREVLKVPNMDVEMAISFVTIKNLLQGLLNFIPAEMRGGMSEFNTHFIRLVHDAVKNRHNPGHLLHKARDSFNTVVRMVGQLPQCQQRIAQIRITHPNLFTNNA